MFKIFSYIGDGDRWMGGEVFVDYFLKHEGRMWNVSLVLAQGTSRVDGGFYVKTATYEEFSSAEDGNRRYTTLKTYGKRCPNFIDMRLVQFGLHTAMKRIDKQIFEEDMFS